MDFRTVFNFSLFAVLMIDCIIELAILKLVDKIARNLGRKQQEQPAPKRIDFPNSHR